MLLGPVVLAATPKVAEVRFDPAWDQDSVDVDVLVKACKVAAACADSAVQSSKSTIVTFCSLADPATTDAWAHPIVIPSREEVRAMAACKKTGASTASGPAVSAMSTAGAFGSVGGDPASAILWGSVDFVLERAEGTARSWLLDQFGRQICSRGDKDTIGGADLLPHSCALLEDPDASILSGGAAALQKAFRADLLAMPRIIGEHVAARAKTTGEKDAATVATVLARVDENVLDGASPAVALAGWAHEVDASSLSCTETPASSFVYALSAVLSVMPRKDGALSQPNETEARFVPLTIAVDFSGKDAWPKDCTVGARRIGDVDVGAIRSLYGSIEGPLGDSARALQSLKDLRKDRHAAQAQVVAAYVEVVRSAIPIVRAALAQSGTTLPNVNPSERHEVEVAVADLDLVFGAFAKGDFADLLVDASALADDLHLHAKLPAELRKAIAFASDIAQAKDPAAARAVLENFAAPADAWKRKRNGAGWTVSLNSYVGGFGGAEKAEGAWAPSGGPSLQIGPEIGWRTNHGCLHGVFFGAFLPVVEVGTLAQWRISHDDVANAPEVGVRQVFAPGAFLTIGFRNAPLTIGLGGSLTPELRKIAPADTAPAGTQPRTVDAARLGAFIALDVPLFP